jgi:hypothetical protein
MPADTFAALRVGDAQKLAHSWPLSRERARGKGASSFHGRTPLHDAADFSPRRKLRN